MRVVMTGGTGRLGRALIGALTARGAQVGSTVHQGSTEGLAAHFHQVDLRQADAVGPAVLALAEALGGVEVFLHAAGLGEGEWDPLFAVNVKAAWLAVQALQPRLAGGNVVLLGSVGAVKAMESPVVHTASHGALAALARSLGKELGAQNTRVNLLALGPLTEGASRALPAELLSEYSKHSCLRRQATPAEAAETIASFALTNTYVTGQVVVLDGGL